MPIARYENGDTKRTVEGRALYTCDSCGKTEPWNDSWAWYGSYRQMEDYGRKEVAPIKTICSSLCRVTLVAAGTIPAEGLDDAGQVIEGPRIKQRRECRATAIRKGE